jgi:hypothetical protein
MGGRDHGVVWLQHGEHLDDEGLLGAQYALV